MLVASDNCRDDRPDLGRQGGAMSGPAGAATYEAALAALAAENPELLVMTAENRAAIRNLPAVLGPRFIDVGICEQTMIGAAAGLALRGRVPVVHALATFLTLRAFEFIRTDVGIGGLPVKLVGYVPGFLSDANGPTHQAIEDVSLMRGIPGMQVVCPADEEELIAALPAVVASPFPCYVRYNNFKPAIERHAPFVLGRAEVLEPPAAAGGGAAAGAGNGQPGAPPRVALLTYGFLLREVVRARDLLAGRGVPARVLNMRTLKPLDEEAVLAAARATGCLVVIEDHFKTGGLYSIVAELLVRAGVTARVHAIALDERWFKPALLPDVLEHEGFTGPRLAERVLAVL
jgi:transketolase